MFNAEWKYQLYRPVMCEPPMCTIAQLSDGTVTIDDIADFNELLNLKEAYQIEAQLKKHR